MKALYILLLSTLLIACSPPSSTNTETQTNASMDSSHSGNADTSNLKTDIDHTSAADINKIQNEIPRLFEEIKTSNDLPSWLEIKMNGTFKFGAKWVDKVGENVMIITSTDAHYPANIKEGGANPDSKSMELYAMQYVKKDKKAVLVWSVNDFVKDCQFDMDLFYVPNSFAVTDINTDGIRETMFMYQSMCRSDVSEDDLKLIMHDGKTKYAIRGTTKIDTGNNQYVGGKMNLDPSFDSAPKGFKDKAVNIWNKFVDVSKRSE